MIEPQARAAIRVKVFLAVLLMTVAGSHVATEVYAWIGPERLPTGWRLAGFAVAMVVLFAGVQTAGSAAAQMLRLQTRRLNKSAAEPRPVLIWFLSALRPKNVAGAEDQLAPYLPQHVSLTWNLEADLRALAEDKRLRQQRGDPPLMWSWEQPLRGIHHSWRAGALRRLILICSHESICQAHRFVEVLRRYQELASVQAELLIPDGHGSRLVAGGGEPLDAHFGWNFEDFDEVWRAVSQLLDQLGQEPGGCDRDLAIDLTGGTKPATVVAATATINREIRNQYVCTNPKDPDAAAWEYEVLDYDLILGNPGGSW